MNKRARLYVYQYCCLVTLSDRILFLLMLVSLKVLEYVILLKRIRPT